MSDRPPFASVTHITVPGTPLEAKCTLRLGLHRWGDNACPKLYPRDRNGCFGWASDTTFWDMPAK